MATKRRRPTDWGKRFEKAAAPKTVTLQTDFAGIRAGALMYIASPRVIADYIASIPRGRTRSIEQMRNDLSRQNEASATCPVTTAIYLRIVAELALDGLNKGQPPAAVTPFWRVVEPGGKIARRLSCGDDLIVIQRALEQSADGG